MRFTFVLEHEYTISTWKDGINVQIPADMVVNAMMVAMMAHANQPSEMTIYQVGSSLSNPFHYSSLQNYGLNYFSKHPWIDKAGNPVKVGKITVLRTMSSFRRYLAIRYLLPLKVRLFFLQVFFFPVSNLSFFFFFWENFWIMINHTINSGITNRECCTLPIFWRLVPWSSSKNQVRKPYDWTLWTLLVL